LFANKEADLQVNATQIMSMFIYHQQNAGQEHNINLSHKIFDNVSEFTDFGT